MKRTFWIDEKSQGRPLRLFLEEKMRFLPRALRNRLAGTRVRVNGETAPPNRVLNKGDKVVLLLPESQKIPMPQAPPETDILYEDAGIVCVNKPSGLAVVQERWEKGRTLLEDLAELAERQADKTDRPPWVPNVIHRIDKETSGVVVVAKDSETARYLSNQFLRREVQKTYVALVRGEMPHEQGEIALALEEDESHPGRMKVARKGGKKSLTRFQVVERFRGFTLVAAKPETGRQHQIRVHLSAIGYPLAVDPLYGGREAILLSEFKKGYKPHEGAEHPIMSRLSLHALSITFRLADKPEPVTVEAPPPKDFRVMLKQLRRFAR